MKKLTLCFLLMSISAIAFSQQANSSLSYPDQDYMLKSKHQKTAAWILLGGGGALTLTSIIIPRGELVHESILQKTYKNDGIKSILGLGGSLATIVSLTLFFLASKNKQKALNLSFKNEQVSQIQKASLVYHTVPSLTLKLSL